MKILFAGEGGQGVQVIAQILAKAAFLEGYSPLYIPNFGVEQRGGVSLAFLVIEKNSLAGYPKFEKANIVAILAERSVERIQRYIDSKSIVILGPGLKNGLKTDLPTKVWNVLILGRVNQEGKIVKIDNLIQALNERFEKSYVKNPILRQTNLQAIKS
jgi:2-oxoglutarate ferredoxin oxidoreductase subunit gamma